MHRTSTPLPALTVLTLLLVAACSSSGDDGPAYHLAALKALLVTGRDVHLAGYLATTPDGEEQAHTATAVVYFNRAGFTDSGLHSSDVASQLSVTLVATAGAAAARAATDTAVSAAAAGLRGTAASTPTSLGSHGRQVAGRAKGDGARQVGVYFVEGDVAVSVILSSVVDAPTIVARDVARAQDTKLRTAA
jgi:hypothetical protein